MTRPRANALSLAGLLAAVGLSAACGPSEQVAFDFAAEIDQAAVVELLPAVDLGAIEARLYLGGGWNDTDSSDDEATWVWGTGEASIVRFATAASHDVDVQLRGRAFPHPDWGRLSVRPLVNGQELGPLVLGEEWTDVEVQVPADIVAAGDNELRLEYSFAQGDGQPLTPGGWIAAWERIEFIGPAGTASPAASAQDGAVRLAVGTSIQYLVPLEPGSGLAIDGLQWNDRNGDPAPRLEVEVVLESPAETRRFSLDPARDELPASWLAGEDLLPQLVLVKMSVSADRESSGRIARIDRPRIVAGAEASPAGSNAAPPRVTTCADCNLLLISIDTLRADRLGDYGNTRGLTPAMDALRRDAILFSDHTAQAPSTLASHASMFTGRVPPRHGASIARRQPLAPEVPTLAELLAEAGFATAAITDGAQLDPQWQLDAGFDHYHSPAVPPVTPRLADNVSLTQDWLAGRAAPFFVFLHTYQVHAPYTPTAEDYRRIGGDYSGSLPDEIGSDLLMQINQARRVLSTDDVDHIATSYDAELLDVDRALGRLVAWLRDRNLYDSTVIVLTSDHGEEFGERDRVGWHSHTLHDELLRVPLLLKLPDSEHAGRTIDSPTSSVDLPPTLLALLGIEADTSEMDGHDIFAGPRPARAVIVAQIDAQDAASAPIAVRTRRWKLLHTTGRLFDLAADPGESASVTGTYPGVVIGLRRALAEILLRGSATADAVEIPEELARSLRDLGYIR